MNAGVGTGNQELVAMASSGILDTDGAGGLQTMWVEGSSGFQVQKAAKMLPDESARLQRDCIVRSWLGQWSMR